jgi:hypothetical protein
MEFLQAIQTRTEYKKGDKVFEEGDLFQRVYILGCGTYHLISGGKIHRIAGEGEIIGYVFVCFYMFLGDKVFEEGDLFQRVYILGCGTYHLISGGKIHRIAGYVFVCFYMFLIYLKALARDVELKLL